MVGVVDALHLAPPTIVVCLQPTCYAQTLDPDNPWIALRKPRIHALRNTVVAAVTSALPGKGEHIVVSDLPSLRPSLPPSPKHSSFKACLHYDSS